LAPKLIQFSYHASERLRSTAARNECAPLEAQRLVGRLAAPSALRPEEMRSLAASWPSAQTRPPPQTPPAQLTRPPPTADSSVAAAAAAIDQAGAISARARAEVRIPLPSPPPARWPATNVRLAGLLAEGGGASFA